MADKIIVLDFGSQYNQLIARRIREFGVYSELHPHTLTLEQIKSFEDVKGIVFSGGPNSVYEKDAFMCDPAIFDSGIPVLGICRGAQIINVYHGGTLYQDLSYRKEKTLKHSQGQTPTLLTHTVKTVAGTKIAELLGKKEMQTNSFHHQLIKDVADDFKVSARCVDGVVEAIENKDASIIAVQWHPEMLHRVVPYQNNLFKYIIDNAKKK